MCGPLMGDRNTPMHRDQKGKAGTVGGGPTCSDDNSYGNLEFNNLTSHR